MKIFLKRVIPEPLKSALRKFILLPSKYMPALFQQNGLLSSFYYFLLNRKFDREHRAVLAGQVAYRKKLSNIGQSCTLLRRNIHRIEKGLIMRPRRGVFAENYILETVQCMDKAKNVEALCADEKKWCIDVLAEYFKIVQPTPTIQAAKAVFSKIKLAENETDQFLPYSYSTLPNHNISIDELNKLFLRRRSVRWYQQKEVPLSVIKQAIDSASLAPSACNRQPYKFYVSSSQDKAVEMAKCAGGTSGFAENLPCVIAIVGDLSAYPEERDRHLIYVDSGLAAMQLMLAFEALALATCPINWPDIETAEKKMQKLLSLDDYQRVVMLLAVGYADLSGGIPYSQKKKANILMKEV